MSLAPPLLRLVEALAAEAVEDYLTAQAALVAAESADATNPVPLPAPSKAA